MAGIGSDKPSLKILVVDDNADDAQLYVRLLSRDPDTTYDFIHVEVGEQGLQRYHDARPDCVLLDYQLPDMDGIEFMQSLAQQFEPACLPVVMLTGQGNEAVAVEAMKSGVRDYLVKGQINASALQRSVRNVIEKVGLERENRELAGQLVVANEDLRTKNKKLSELTETAHRFVDNVAHDFRTPLMVISEFSKIISDGLSGPVTPEQTDQLQMIVTATEDLAQMVDDFLDSSKLKAKVLRVDRRPQQIDPIIQSVRCMLTPRAVSEQIRLITQVQPDLPPVFADAKQIRRVLVNLTTNAIKFSKKGSDVVIWARAHKDTDVEVGISDHGPGLTEADLAVIFDRFKQVGDMQRAGTKGFGLGLNIAKELVWLNLGTVHVQSQYGHGSTFSFTLPPHNRSLIVSRYFERLAELDEPPVNLAVLRVEPAGPVGDIEDVRQFLASTCYPIDLVLKLSDGASVVAIGSTQEPDRWVRRVEAGWSEKARKSSQGVVCPLRIGCVACLPYAGLMTEQLSALLGEILGRRACA